MGKIIKEKHTYVIDEEGHTITTVEREYGNSMSVKKAIQMGIIAMPNDHKERLRLFSKSELKELGYDSEEEDL